MVSDRTLQPSTEPIVANSSVQSDFSVESQFSGLGNVHPLLTSNMFFRPLRLVPSSSFILCSKPVVDVATYDKTGSGWTLRPLVHALHVGDLESEGR